MSENLGGDPGLIVLVGGESTGKSTLAHALARDLPAIEVAEVLREWVADQGRVPRPDEQWDVMDAQVERESEALDEAGHTGIPWVVSDGGAIMTAVYSSLYYSDESLTPAALRLARRARLVVWCDHDFPWVPDPEQRDGPEMRDAAQRIIAATLEPSGLPWLRVSGDLAARTAAVRRRLTGGA